MKEVKGKCKSCLGCGRLENEWFRGYHKCKNYVFDGREEEENNINVFTYPNTYGIIDT